MTRAMSKPAPKARRYKVKLEIVERAETSERPEWCDPFTLECAVVNGINQAGCKWLRVVPHSIKVRRITPERKRK